jgi:heptosyltransferase-3
LGDTLLLVPALRALRTRWPEAHLNVLSADEPGQILVSFGLAHSVTDNSDARMAPLAVGVIQGSGNDLVRALGDPDLVVLVTSSAEPAARVLGQMGIRHAMIRPQPPIGVHAAEQVLQGLAEFDVTEPWTDAEAIAPAPAIQGQAASCVVVVHPGAGARWKCAPTRTIRVVIDELERLGRTVVVLEGPADKSAVAALGTSAVQRSVNLVGLTATLAGARVYLGHDSGVSHLAGLLGIPTVVLFGPTHPTTWRPLGPHVSVLRACDRPPADAIRVCDDPDCLAAIQPEAIVAAVMAAGRR